MKISLKKRVMQNQLIQKIGKYGIFTFQGRFCNSMLPEETITPIVLPRGETLVRLLIEACHVMLLHAWRSF